MYAGEKSLFASSPLPVCCTYLLQPEGVPRPASFVDMRTDPCSTYVLLVTNSHDLPAIMSVNHATPWRLQAQFLSGHTSDQSCAGNCYGSTCIKEPQIAFINQWSSGRCPASSMANVTVSEVSETTLLPQVEWIE